MSPSATHGSSKRKRNPDKRLLSPTASVELQASSRDASSEDAADSASNTAMEGMEIGEKRKDLSGTGSSKRPKTVQSSPASKEDINGADHSVIGREGGENGGDEEESSLSSRHKASEQMAPPERGGLLHPVGYKTNPPPEGRPVRIYADGVFDLFHLGHMRQLEQAKKAFPSVYLLVGVTGDEETHKRKGLTVLSGTERAETMRHCKWVDDVLPNCPWIVTPEFLHKHQIDYVAHDDEPYGADEGDDIYAPIKKEGKFLVTQRTEGVSTTGIITKIVRDYEKYIARQLKRGTSRQELNVSWLKKNELDLKRHVIELRDSVKNNWASTGQELSKEFRQYWRPSRPSSPAPGFSSRSADVQNAGLMPASSKMNGSTQSPVSPTITSQANASHLDIPRPTSPGGSLGPSNDFAAGYSLGLIGGVRSWMTRSRTSLHDSQPNSGESDHESADQAPI